MYTCKPYSVCVRVYVVCVYTIEPIHILGLGIGKRGSGKEGGSGGREHTH